MNYIDWNKSLADSWKKATEAYYRSESGPVEKLAALKAKPCDCPSMHCALDRHSKQLASGIACKAYQLKSEGAK